ATADWNFENERRLKGLKDVGDALDGANNKMEQFGLTEADLQGIDVVGLQTAKQRLDNARLEAEQAHRKLDVVQELERIEKQMDADRQKRQVDAAVRVQQLRADTAKIVA